MTDLILGVAATRTGLRRGSSAVVAWTRRIAGAGQVAKEGRAR